MHNSINSQQKKHYLTFIILWIVVNTFFWQWWLKWENIGQGVLFTLMSIAFFYEFSVLPSFYLFFLGQMKKPQEAPNPDTLPEGTIKRVAVITLTVPGSESISIVEKQLIAMTQIKYPHDSWILVDKVHSPQIQELANNLGVYYFCRLDECFWGPEIVNNWNQPIPPFKGKTKAGNVNTWLNAYGENYSHFTQLDIDHIPVPEYLHEVLGYFSNPQVAWVQAPSVYGNLNYWTARGSAEQELVLQGPLQMGFYGFSQTPFIIGSHCTYDRAAIDQIGGFQPTRAEDHLDTVFLAANGKRGVFLPKIIAIGDGPETFDIYMAQQFAWAFSMIQVLFNYTYKCLPKYTFRQGIQFLFAQTWYPLWSLSMGTLFVLPLVSLIINNPISHVSYWQFLLHSLPLNITAFGFWWWSRQWHQPFGLNLSWRGIVLHMARWSIVLSALIQVILRVKKPYMITSKGLHNGDNRPFSISAHIPYLSLFIISIITCWFYLEKIGHSSSQGYLFFALQGALMLLTIFIASIAKDLHDLHLEGINFGKSLRIRFQPLVLIILLSVMFIWTSANSADEISMAMLNPSTISTLARPVPEKDKDTIALNPTISPIPSNAETKPQLNVWLSIQLHITQGNEATPSDQLLSNTMTQDTKGNISIHATIP